ncbi:MAG: L-aspartate oxidase [Methyloceanibacter sp.]
MTKSNRPAPARSTLPAPGGVVIVGAGLAGLFTALKLAPMPVTVVSSAPIGQGGSSIWAQGGIAAALAEGDSPEAHAVDTVRGGAGIVDAEIALIMVREARDRVEDLLRYGVPFDKDLEGHLDLGREAAHGSRRILHVKGDTAGHAIMAALTAAARATPSIHVLEGWAARDLVMRDGHVDGIEVARLHTDPFTPGLVLEASAVVLATGGSGQLYAITTNPRESRGEGIAIAARAGAAIADAEFVQYHPTAMNIGRDPAPLATEALRGEGAFLINGKGERFMRALHPAAELGRRDIVALGVYREVMSGSGAFLDCRKLGPDLPSHFPTVFAICQSVGLDPRRDPIPVAPAAHYHMGGVLTDANGRSTVDGLWACGEVASTGAHGANRLASNSLLEAVVFGARVARDIAQTVETAKSETPELQEASLVAPAEEPDSQAVQMLRRTMTAKVGVIRDEKSLTAALGVIAGLEQSAAPSGRLGNMLTAAKLITTAALMRKESRGAHLRSDYPDADPKLARRSFLTLAEAVARASEVDARGRAPRWAAPLHA